jgi:hypothetical protein
MLDEANDVVLFCSSDDIVVIGQEFDGWFGDQDVKALFDGVHSDGIMRGWNTEPFYPDGAHRKTEGTYGLE